MRTPGHDVELALGFLLTEGIARSPADIAGATSCADNVVDVTLGTGASDRSVSRNFYTTSSCGMCGKASIDAVRTTSAYDVSTDPVRVASATLVALPDRLRDAQRVFDRTGGLHAAGLFTAGGELLCLREDVGRHNAVDKVVGWAVQQGLLPLTGTVLQVSGRASFELVQKAVMAGVPILAAVSAPSSLAVELAAECGLTLVGFLRGASYNLYAGGNRVTRPPTAAS
jgi:FdhD protein